jgi:Cu(I)/Ag(I) efflux system membrane fusion protein
MMQRIANPIFILSGLAAILAGCSMNMDHDSMDNPATTPIPAITFDVLFVVNGGDNSLSVINKTVPDSFQAGIGKVYDGYLRIESALAHDDFTGAKEAFQTMHAVLHVIPKDRLDSVQKADWDSLDVSFMEVLHPMAASQDIAEMRNHLADFTPLVVTALEKFGAHTSNHAYLFHCPMARKNAGADWLQPDTSRLNPYFGRSMPKCGSYVKEIGLIP